MTNFKSNFKLAAGVGDREKEQFLGNLQTHCNKLAVTVANGVNKKSIAV